MVMAVLFYSPKQKESRMQQQAASINPDIVCQQAVQAKLFVYQAKEHFESVLKTYNDQIDNLIGLVNLMKNRIMELEKEKESPEIPAKEIKKT